MPEDRVLVHPLDDGRVLQYLICDSLDLSLGNRPVFLRYKYWQDPEHTRQQPTAEEIECGYMCLLAANLNLSGRIVWDGGSEQFWGTEVRYNRNNSDGVYRVEFRLCSVVCLGTTEGLAAMAFKSFRLQHGTQNTEPQNAPRDLVECAAKSVHTGLAPNVPYLVYPY